jgi:hypothetical protein
MCPEPGTTLVGKILDNRIKHGEFGKPVVICLESKNKLNHKGYISSFTNIPPYSV